MDHSLAFPMPTPHTLEAQQTASPFTHWRADHAGLRVPDFHAATAWYGETLGLRVLHTLPLGEKTLALLGLPGDSRFRIEFIAGPGCTPRPPFDQLADTHGAEGWHHLCFKVDDLDRDITLLRQRGVRIVSEPRDAPALGLRFAFFSDPWGNLFELAQPLPGRDLPGVHRG